MTSQYGYESPFSWRYGSDEMRALWSETATRRRWRRVWVALAEAQSEAGLVTAAQLKELRAHADDVNLSRASEIEAEIRHDLVAELRVYAEQCPTAGGILHLGATSMDVKDNADVLAQQEALDLILGKLGALLLAFAEQIERWADVPCIGWTHLQPAEPTTVGYRLAVYAQDLLADESDLRRLRASLKGKGIKGAVGTGASFGELLEGTPITPADLERRVMALLGLDAFPVTNQTYPRRQEWAILNGLAGLAMTLYRFAFDLRVLQSPPIGEWSEPFGDKQVGSSAMPFKRNPISAESLDSLGRYVAVLPRVLWDDAAHSLLERTLDDSANRRIVIPEAFLATDEIVQVALRLVAGLRIDEVMVARNLARFAAFAATERVLVALSRAGANRQDMHERIRQHSLAAWEAVRANQPNPLADLLATDPMLTAHIPAETIRSLMDASHYTGDAPYRAREMAEAIRAARNQHS